MQPLLESLSNRHAPINVPLLVTKNISHLKVIFNVVFGGANPVSTGPGRPWIPDDLPKTESLRGDKASKKGNVTKNHRLKNELNVMHFHEDEV